MKRAKWDPARHPRNGVGRFIEVGGDSTRMWTPDMGTWRAQHAVREKRDLSAGKKIGSSYSRGMFEGLQMNRLSRDQRETMDHYIYSSEINDHLRAGTDLGWRQREVGVLDDAIEQSRLKNDSAVYRGLGQPGEDFGRELQVGDQILDRGFLSTSANPAVAADYGESLLEIQVPKGTHALPITKANTAEYGGMDEVLLGRGTVIEIDSIDESRMDELGYRVIRARLIGYMED